MFSFLKRTKSLLGSDGMEVYDVAIVGGGFAGSYMAYKLKSINKKLKVVIFEKSHRLGGRLLSDESDAKSNLSKNELGGMRLYPSVHQEVAKIIAECGCNLVPVGAMDKDNLFFSQGKGIKKKHVILDEATGRTPKTLMQEILKKFQEEYGNGDPLEMEAIRDLCARDILRHFGATETEIKNYFDYTGYDLFTDDEVAASIFVKDFALYNNMLDDEQKFVKEGYQEVAGILAQRSKAEIKLRCEVISTETAGDLKKLETSDGDYFAKTVVYATTADALGKIAKGAGGSGLSSARIECLEGIKPIALFKCFLNWDQKPNEKQWWEKMNFHEGKSTTDELIRQVHYYDHGNLLIYNSGANAEELGELFERDENQAVHKVFGILKLIHSDDSIPEPNWDNTRYKLWPDGSHKWKKGVDISSSMKTLLIGSEADSNDKYVYVCGEAYSTHQGWVMGCIETANIVLKAMKKRGVLKK